MKKIILLFTILLGVSTVYAQTKLPAFFNNNMVLQQNEEVAVWGKDSPETKIEVIGSWGKKAMATVSADSTWKLQIQTPPAGGPYTLTVNGNDKIVFTDVLIGEVWFCSGQSNMQWILRNTSSKPGAGSNQDILHSTNENIRVFQTKRIASKVPLANVTGEWKHTNPANAGEFSSVAYWYGKALQEILDVPVGLIVSCWGGSNVEAWLDKETHASFNYLPSIKNAKKERKVYHTPTILYNAMIHPFLTYNMKGVIWYQGESNHKQAADYKILFPAMIDLWRNKWEQGNFPFYFVQIAPYNYTSGANSAYLREAQLFTMQNVENTGMAVTLDIGNCHNIHPLNKKTVSDRLAYWALAKTYGIEGIACSAPVYKSMSITDDGKVELSFDLSNGKLTSFDKPITAFTIAGNDRKFYPAEAKINKNSTITVWSDEVKRPVAVRYAFENCTNASLYNNAGLPVSSFRTDDWKE